jgi:hypothetical protein
MPVEARNFHQPKHPAGAYTEDGTERVLHINLTRNSANRTFFFYFYFFRQNKRKKKKIGELFKRRRK